jgi:hypothetical protein
LGDAQGVPNITVGVVVGLIISVGWIVGGYSIGLAEAMKTVGYSLGLVVFVFLATLINLILIPICLREKEWGFFSAMIISLLTIVLVIAVGPVATLISTGGQSTFDFYLAVGGGICWLFIQIPIVVFSLLAYRKNLLKKTD